MATAEAQRQRMAYLREQHRCCRCMKQDAYTITGKRLCCECTEREAERHREYRERNAEKVAAYQKKRYERLKEEGLCTVCGKRKAKRGGTRCGACARLHAANSKRYRSRND